MQVLVRLYTIKYVMRGATSSITSSIMRGILIPRVYVVSTALT